ncbi:MAG: murein peptide amidase A [Thiomicrorhabdus sp.]|nr:MAG: murein peptide amidase A [Thiomicrorhabdus sp.]
MFKTVKILLFLVSLQAYSIVSYANSSKLAPVPNNDDIKQFCKELSKKLRTVSYEGCLSLDLKVATTKSVENRALTFREYIPQAADSIPVLPKGRILFLSGIHGDELSSISITYLWMLTMLQDIEASSHHWLFLPLVNPDGLLGKSPATRTNARGVDLNRNFPSPDWDQLALQYWKQYYRKNKRRNPGPSPSSEPENQWVVDIIERFKPDAIISVHAPYGLLDYDGPEHATPDNIGRLKHKELGTYPGSLGRYAGEYLKIPVLTLELHSAGSMPSSRDIYKMWVDIERWSQAKIEHGEDDF